MAVEVHVEGRVASGHLPDFAEAVQRYTAYAAANGYAVPHVLLGLSGLRARYGPETCAARKRCIVAVPTFR